MGLHPGSLSNSTTPDMSEPSDFHRRTFFQILTGLSAAVLASCTRSDRTRQKGLAGVLFGGGSARQASASGGTLRPTGKVQHGKASWYSVRTNRGRTTASGEPLSNSANTAAHRHLPFGTLVKVTNLRNDRSEVVRITDRGPFIRGRIIDVTVGVGERLGMVKAGVVPVKVEVMEPRGGRRSSA